MALDPLTMSLKEVLECLVNGPGRPLAEHIEVLPIAAGQGMPEDGIGVTYRGFWCRSSLTPEQVKKIDEVCLMLGVRKEKAK